jgi:hypothetical protein
MHHLKKIIDFALELFADSQLYLIYDIHHTSQIIFIVLYYAFYDTNFSFKITSPLLENTFFVHIQNPNWLPLFLASTHSPS